MAQKIRIACQCRGHRFNPWSGKIPHAVEPPRLCPTNTEPECIPAPEVHVRRACAPQQEKPLQREALTPKQKVATVTATRES